MDKWNFDSKIEDLFNYFQGRQPKENTLLLWHKELQHIKPHIFLWCIEKIKTTYESIPRNLPMTIKNVSCGYYDAHPEKIIQDTNYDPIEDDRYPISKQWEAYRILKRQGEEAYLRYCTANKMPENRREAVVDKYNLSNKDKEPANLADRIGIHVDSAA